MSTATDRFFIALLPPQAIQDYANAVRQVFADRYESRAAFQSPPHITLQLPFEWSLDRLPLLHQALNQFAAQSAPLAIDLSGFGAFPPRVIYINVIKTQALVALQAALLDHLEQALGIVDAVSKTRSFTPHITVAFRDLTEENFKLAWSEFEQRPLTFEFTATQLTLLQHNGQRWTVNREFLLLGRESAAD